MSSPQKEHINIFIAYSRRDKEYLEKLRTYLKPLEREGVKVWYDGEIVPGTEWEQDIKRNLHAADIIVLLISADSLASDYFYEKEVEDALERHHAGEAIVTPTILRYCDWQTAKFADLQVLPTDGKPLKQWNDEDEAYTNIVYGFRRTIYEVKQRRIKIEQTRLAEIERKKKIEAERKYIEEQEHKRKTEEEEIRKAEEKRIEEQLIIEQKKREEELLSKTRIKNRDNINSQDGQTKISSILPLVLLCLFVVAIYFYQSVKNYTEGDKEKEVASSNVSKSDVDEKEEDIIELIKAESSLTMEQRIEIIAAKKYLSQIIKPQKYSLRIMENQKVLFPNRTNQVKPYNVMKLQSHVTNLTLLTSMTLGSNIDRRIKQELQNASNQFKLHEENYYPKGFKRLDYKRIQITEQDAKKYDSVLDLGQAYNVSWKLLVEFNPVNIERIGIDKNGDPVVRLRWKTTKESDETLTAYIPK